MRQTEERGGRASVGGLKASVLVSCGFSVLAVSLGMLDYERLGLPGLILGIWGLLIAIALMLWEIVYRR